MASMEALRIGQRVFYAAGRRRRPCTVVEKLDKRHHAGTRVRVEFDDPSSDWERGPQTVMVTSLEPMPEPDPASLTQYRTALGPRVCAELEKAKPEPWGDAGVMLDRFTLNGPALGYWLLWHFGVNLLTAGDDELSHLSADPLGERVTVYGVDYLIPYWCYLSTGLLPGDQRPTEPSPLPRDG